MFLVDLASLLCRLDGLDRGFCEQWRHSVGIEWGIACFAVTIPHFVPQLRLSCPRTATDDPRLEFRGKMRVFRALSDADGRCRMLEWCRWRESNPHAFKGGGF